MSIIKSIVAVIVILSAEVVCANAAPSLLQGRVYDKKTGANVSAPIVISNAVTGEVYIESRSNSSTGSYAAVITATSSCNIKVVVEAEGYPRTEKIMKFTYTGEYQEISYDIALEVKKVPPPAAPKPIKKKKKKGVSSLQPFIGTPKFTMHT